MKSAKSKPWTGKYANRIYSNGTRLKWTGQWWLIRNSKGKIISRHDSLLFAKHKARRLDEQERPKHE